MISMDTVRARIQLALGPLWSEELWALLQDLAVVEDMRYQRSEMEQVIRIARRMVRLPHGEVAGQRAERQAARTQAERDRLIAVSDLLATEAAGDEDVIKLRAIVGHLIPWTEVEFWVTKQAAEDGDPTMFVEVPVSAGPIRPTPEGLAFEGAFVAPTYAWRHPAVAYLVPGEDWPKLRRTKLGGVLDQLRGVSQDLADRFGWDPAQAATWVLTGITPAYASMSATVALRELGPATRILLTVDPGLPADDVARFYNRVRGDIRRRSLGARQARLGAFLAARGAEAWPARLAAWNRQYPGWNYGHLSNFRRDCRVVVRRLLRPLSERSRTVEPRPNT